MKNLTILLLFISFCARAQEKKDIRFSFEFGYIAHFNSLNNNDYYWTLTGGSNNLKSYHMQGLNMVLKYSLKTPKLDLILGSLVEVSPRYVNASSSSISENYMNGGGIYGGISKNIGNDYVGMNIDFGLGYFTYKDVKIYDRGDNQIYDVIATGGLGGTASLGFYAGFRQVQINPKINVIFSSGSGNSIILYGFMLPLVLKF